MIATADATAVSGGCIPMFQCQWLGVTLSLKFWVQLKRFHPKFPSIHQQLEQDNPQIYLENDLKFLFCLQIWYCLLISSVFGLKNLLRLPSKSWNFALYTKTIESLPLTVSDFNSELITWWWWWLRNIKIEWSFNNISLKIICPLFYCWQDECEGVWDVYQIIIRISRRTQSSTLQ